MPRSSECECDADRAGEDEVLRGMSLRVGRGEMVALVGSSEPELDGEILSAALDGLALIWLAHPNDPDFEKRLRRMVRQLLEKYPLRDAPPRRPRSPSN